MGSSVVQGFTKSLAMTVYLRSGTRHFSQLLSHAKGLTTSRHCCFWGLACGLYGMHSMMGYFVNVFTFSNREADEFDEVEKELDAIDLKKQNRPFLTQFLSPILLKAFSITFFGEWGDKSQLATIGLAADENPLGVVLGGILGQALCTTAAVLGGKSLATQISEKIISLSGGVLFIFLESNLFFRPLIHRDFKTKADTNLFYQVKLFY